MAVGVVEARGPRMELLDAKEGVGRGVRSARICDGRVFWCVVLDVVVVVLGKC